jgi:RNA polymerase sigma-70 factor (ECF subfamily)
METYPDNPFPCVLDSWQRHEGELRGYLRHRLGDIYLADDLIQDVFLKAMRQGRQFCGLVHPRAWLFQVARNAMVDALRVERPTIPLPDDLMAPEPDMPAVDAVADCLPLILDRLRAEDSDILRQCDLAGTKQLDYARAHGLTLPATKARLLRARQRMRDALIRDCGVRFDEAGSVCCHTAQRGGGSPLPANATR